MNNNNKILLSASLIIAFLVFVVVNNGNSSLGVTGTSGGTPSLSPQNFSNPTPTNTQVPITENENSTEDNGMGEEGSISKPIVAPVPKKVTTATAPSTKVPPAPRPAPVAPTAPTATTPRGRFTDGTFTGSAIDVYYGIVQVQVTISGGNITDVQFLSYPSDRQRSLQIAQHAMPILRSEAIAAQSAPVDAVSGASATSDGFNQSLQSALAQAGA